MAAAALAIPTAVYVAESASAADCINAVPGSTFEIDPDANLVVNTTNCIDWLNGGSLRGTNQADKPSGSGDDSFGQGTAENDTSPTIVTGSIPPNKSDLKNFGVNTETAAGKFLQLFWTRVQNPSGTTNMDFELNQKFCDTTVTPFKDCANNGKNVVPETPVRTVGDKLITYDLSKGGTVPTISIRTWSGSVWGAPTVISGAGGQAIGSVNTSTITLANSGGLGPFDPYTFGEASLSYTALFGGSADCTTFGSAYLKSRSSDSFTAEVKDFISPERVTISNCTGIVTSATASVTIGSPISDTATLAGATTNAGGTITFALYSDSTCTTAVTTGLTPVTVNGNGDYNSGNYTPTAVGTYYWIASYSGDLNNSPSVGKCGDANESSVVVKQKPSISTSATASVTIGSPISDTATLSGATTDVGGTITFALYSNDTCTTAVNTGLQPVTVSGNGNYSSGNYTPTAVGTYYWIASYSGDAKNEPVSGTCKDSNESSVVTKQKPSISTSATASVTIGSPISDTATLSGATTNAGGTITFALYSDDTCTTAVNTGLQPVTVSGNGNYSSGNYTPTAVGTYYWIASYSGDANNEPVAGKCKDSGESSVVNKAQADIATAQSFYPQDSVTVSAGTGGTPTGTVTFKLFGPDAVDCSGTAAYTESNVGLTSGSAATANKSFVIDAAKAGGYKWLVSYSGDDTHLANAGVCADETSSVAINNNAIQ